MCTLRHPRFPRAGGRALFDRREKERERERRRRRRKRRRRRRRQS